MRTSNAPTESSATTASPSHDAPSPSLTARIAGASVGGTWLARIIQAPSAFADLVSEVPFQDRVLDVKPGCAKEPCGSVTLRVFFLDDPDPVYSATLTRAGDSYVSPGAPAGPGPCLGASGSEVQGGATLVRVVSVWRERVTTPGTAITLDQVRGEVRYDATPNKLGTAAGCSTWSVRYSISAETPWGVPTKPPVPTATPTPPTTVTASGLVALPMLTYGVKGATVTYFAVSGSTVSALAESVAKGGVRACGEIQYEWYRGDPRPSGCAEYAPTANWITPVVNDSNGACFSQVTGPLLTYAVHLPQWRSPRLVPRPLLDWWRKVVAFIGAHEAGHIRIAQQAAASLAQQVSGAPCALVKSIVDSWSAKLQAAQGAFDKREYAKPWPSPPAGY